jgi:hypothetical protein
MKTLWSVILALLLLAAKTAMAALIAIAPVRLLRSRSADAPPAPVRQGTRLVRSNRG